MGTAKGPKLGPNEVSPQKQPVVDNEVIANKVARVAIVNCFGRDIESPFVRPVDSVGSRSDWLTVASPVKSTHPAGTRIVRPCKCYRVNLEKTCGLLGL